MFNTNHPAFIAAFDLSVVYMMFGGSIVIAAVLFAGTKLLGNIIFTDKTNGSDAE